MKIHYDPTVDVLDITFKEKTPIAKTKEIGRGLLLDVDKKDTPVGLEVIGASHRYSPSELKKFRLPILKKPARQ